MDCYNCGHSIKHHQHESINRMMPCLYSPCVCHKWKGEPPAYTESERETVNKLKYERLGYNVKKK